jgi:hypothetical protein
MSGASSSRYLAWGRGGGLVGWCTSAAGNAIGRISAEHVAR